MLNDPERFRGHDPNLNPGGEFIFLPVFLAQRKYSTSCSRFAVRSASQIATRPVASRTARRLQKSDIVSILVCAVHFVTFVRDNVS